MKPTLPFAVITMLLVASSISRSQAQTSDITVNNGFPGGYAEIDASNTNPDPRPGVDALGYVNAGDVADKIWDLEAFGYNSQSSTLTYVGGFNPNGVVDSNTGISYGLGDIFFSPVNSQIAGTANQPTLPSSNPVDNPVSSQSYLNPGYTYAIHLNSVTSSTINYSLYALSSQAQLKTVEFQVNQASGPYALNVPVDLANGSITLLGSGTATIFDETNAQINSLLNEQLFTTSVGDPNLDNYVASFNLADLDLSSFNVDVTEQCGNDLLSGSYNPALLSTPEPGSIYLGMLASVALCGVIGLTRKLRDQDQDLKGQTL
jgi:hypothetical protein